LSPGRKKLLCQWGQLLVIGGVAAETIAAHLCSQISAALPIAPDASAVSACGAGALLVGLTMELIASRDSQDAQRRVALKQRHGTGSASAVTTVTR